MATRPTDFADAINLDKPIVARAWERAKQGISVRIFGIRLFLKVRRATPLATNRWALFRKRLAALISGGKATGTAILDGSARVANDHRVDEQVRGVAVIVGVGDGLGSSLVKHLSQSGMQVAAIARDQKNLKALMEAGDWPSESVKLYACDATHQSSFNNALECIRSDLGIPDLVIYLVHYSMSAPAMEIEPTALEESWRANCLGGFIVARNCARLMISRGSGTIIFAGATSAIIGRARYLGLATGKFALRALTQVLARELWPHGIHVAHVLIDGASFYFGRDRGIAGTDPEAAARTFLHLHRQAKNAWTHELDLRPWNEDFWKHC